MADLYSKSDELQEYLFALKLGKQAIVKGQNPPPPPEPIDINAWKLSFRNQVIAGSSYKSNFFGTATEEPTVTAETLKSLGLTATAANAIIAERDKIRADALALIK